MKWKCGALYCDLREQMVQHSTLAQHALNKQQRLHKFYTYSREEPATHLVDLGTGQHQSWRLLHDCFRMHGDLDKVVSRVIKPGKDHHTTCALPWVSL